MTVLVSVLAGAACWSFVSAGTGLRRLGARRRVGPGHTRPSAAVLVVVGALLLVLLFVVGGAAGAGLAVGGAIVGWLVVRLARAGRLRSQRRRRRLEVLEFCDALAAEMRAGLPVAVAVERSCSGLPELSGVGQVARFGGDLCPALDDASRRPGAEGLRAVGVAWKVAATSGAALAQVLDRVGAALRADEDARAEVEAALAPPRATAKLLAVLPAFGVLLGESMGAQPVRFLLGTGIGVLCLGCGLMLALAGVVWVERIAAGVEG